MSQVYDRYHFFWNGPFSQWKRAVFDIEGVEFNTAEQAMMYQKAILFDDATTARKILDTRDARLQKALGRQVRGFDHEVWEAERESIVRRGNLAKFRQNRGLRRKLFQTGDKHLVEASALDAIWGIGLDETAARTVDPQQWPGLNLLGKILDDVRAELAAMFPDEARSVKLEQVSDASF